MAQIKVTGWLDTDDMDPEDVDLTSDLGVSEKFFLEHNHGVTVYEPEYELQP